MDEKTQQDSEKDPASENPLFYENKTLHIYCPASIAFDFIELSNKEFAGKQYAALSHLLRSWKEARHVTYLLTEIMEIKEDNDELVKRIEMLENSLEEKIEEPKVKKKTLKTITGEVEVED
uniref:Uncharacterized protein n=1 Tax=viral metagenome TaxID=1070528 RepID=A0A6M3JRG2_9ZZZZ